MEFILELEDSDLIIDFEPDFLCENFSDRTALRWEFRNKNYTGTMANVFNLTPEGEGS